MQNLHRSDSRCSKSSGLRTPTSSCSSAEFSREFINSLRKYGNGASPGCVNGFGKVASSVRRTLPYTNQQTNTTNGHSKSGQNGKAATNSPAATNGNGSANKPVDKERVKSLFDRLSRPKHVVATVFQRKQNPNDRNGTSGIRSNVVRVRSRSSSLTKAHPPSNEQEKVAQIVVNMEEN